VKIVRLVHAFLKTQTTIGRQEKCDRRGQTRSSAHIG